jgi:hypothetical protein
VVEEDMLRGILALLQIRSIISVLEELVLSYRILESEVQSVIMAEDEVEMVTKVQKYI